MAVSWCLFCRRESKVIVSVSSILKVNFCKGYIIWHVPSFNWLLLCNSPNHISCYYCMKEKSELTMCFVTHSRTISLQVPLGTIHDTVFNLACFQHKKHSVSSAKPPVHPLHTRTLIYAMFCLVRKLVLSYRASPSPFLSSRSFPRCAFFFNWGRPEFRVWFVFVLRQTGAHTNFCVFSDRTSHIHIFVPIFHVLTPLIIITIS